MGSTPERADDGIVVVDSWRDPGLELQLLVPAAELDRAEAARETGLEVIETDGLLGIPSVQSARLVAP